MAGFCRGDFHPTAVRAWRRLTARALRVEADQAFTRATHGETWLAKLIVSAEFWHLRVAGRLFSAMAANGAKATVGSIVLWCHPRFGYANASFRH